MAREGPKEHVMKITTKIRAGATAIIGTGGGTGGTRCGG